MIPHSRPTITAEDIQAVIRQLASEMLCEGAVCAELERRLAETYGFVDAVLVGSGSQALLLAMRLRGVKRGSQVVLPAYVCPEVLGVVEEIEAVPILADVDENYCLDPTDPTLCNNVNIDAVIVPSLFGITTNMAPYLHWSGSLIADWAQYAPVPPISAAPPEVAILSFEATKILAGGEGGAILVQRKEHAVALRAMKRLRGSDMKLNLYPMSDLQAALILSQLERLDELLARRRCIANRYDDLFAKLGRVRIVRRSASDTVFRYIVKLESKTINMENVIAAFTKHGVAVRRPVAVLLHHVRLQQRSFPTADRLFEETLSIPLYPGLDDAEVERVLDAAKMVLS